MTPEELLAAMAHMRAQIRQLLAAPRTAATDFAIERELQRIAAEMADHQTRLARLVHECRT
jgi:hypothetical protein